MFVLFSQLTEITFRPFWVHICHIVCLDEKKGSANLTSWASNLGSTLWPSYGREPTKEFSILKYKYKYIYTYLKLFKIDYN